MRRVIFLVLFLVGTAAPLTAFAPWLMANGLDARRFFGDLFANRVSAFFALDVIVSAIVTLALLAFAARRLGMLKSAGVVVATLVVGVSSGLPLFLLLNESTAEAGAAA
jgi:uncharacterized membrane protein (UPF0182 family)